MQLLSRDAILGAQDREPQKVEIPEWGGAVLVAPMDSRTRDEFEGEQVALKDTGRAIENFRARIVAACVVDEAGARLFTAEDAAALGKKSGAAIDRIVDVAIRINGMSQKDVEELAGE